MPTWLITLRSYFLTCSELVCNFSNKKSGPSLVNKESAWISLNLNNKTEFPCNFYTHSHLYSSNHDSWLPRSITIELRFALASLGQCSSSLSALKGMSTLATGRLWWVSYYPIVVSNFGGNPSRICQSSYISVSNNQKLVNKDSYYAKTD